jgi:Tfp pilus assembly PilM family ATPase
MRRSKEVFIELTPTRLDVLLIEGTRCGGARRIPLSLPGDVNEWLPALDTAARPLAAAVEALGATGARATVLYQSPTHAIDHTSLPLRPAEAQRAAVQQCLDALPYPDDLAVWATAVVGRDARGAPPPCHVVAVAEREDVLEGVAGLMEQAGLALAIAVPSDAATFARLIWQRLRQRGGQSGWLSIGEHTSFFLVEEEGVLAFARQIGIGLNTMAVSLTRQIGGAGECPIPDVATARQILQKHGLPAPDVLVHEGLGLRGSQVIPLLQPVLQRFLVELRQSMRFGLTPDQRQRLNIRLTGPGGGLHGLASLIQEEMTVPVSPAEHAGDGAWIEAGADATDLVQALENRPILGRLGLEPRRASLKRRTRRLQHCLWAGGAAAVLVVGADTFRYQQAATSLERQRDALEAQATEQETLQATTARLASVVAAIETLERTIEREMSSAPDFAGALHELSLLAPKTIRMDMIRVQRDGERGSGGLGGIALDDPQGRSELETFIARLQGSALFADVALESVQMAEARDAEGARFHVSFVPVLGTQQVAAEAGGQGGGP